MLALRLLSSSFLQLVRRCVVQVQRPQDRFQADTKHPTAPQPAHSPSSSLPVSIATTDFSPSSQPSSSPSVCSLHCCLWEKERWREFGPHTLIWVLKQSGELRRICGSAQFHQLSLSLRPGGQRTGVPCVQFLLAFQIIANEPNAPFSMLSCCRVTTAICRQVCEDKTLLCVPPQKSWPHRLQSEGQDIPLNS